MKTNQFDNLEDMLRTLGKRADLSLSSKRSIRDKVFQSIGQIELADAIVSGEQKATVVSLQYLKRALMPQKLSFSMPATVATVAFVFMASIMTGALAQGSDPSGVLFPVKKVLERIELAFISDPVSKAKVSLNIANERLMHVEASLDETKEIKLNKILRESQIALVSARQALEKAKESNTESNNANISDLVERFSSLIADQKTILNNINETETSEDVKKTVLAIRQSLSDEESKSILDKSETDVSADVVVNPENTKAEEVIKPIILPTEGLHTLKGRIGTAYGKPAIYIADDYYQIISSPLNLSQYVGYESVELTGDIFGDTIKVYRVVINNIVLIDNLSSK